MTAKSNDNDVNRREYWERAVSNPKEHELTDRQAQAMRESLTLTDPENWEKVLAAPETYELNAEQAKHLAEWATRPRHERNQLTPAEEIEAEAGFHEAFYGAEHVRTWLEMGAVSPMNAALLLHAKNPSKYKGTAPDFGEAFDLMILAFEDTARDGHVRSLHDWLSVARDRKLTGQDVVGWTACSQVFLAERTSLAQQAASQPQDAPVLAESADDASAREPQGAASGPKFTMNRGALVAAHKHEWPTIEGDIKGATRNELAKAKAGVRGWDEKAALDWARAKGKLIGAAIPADALTHAMHSMNNLPSQKHTLNG